MAKGGIRGVLMGTAVSVAGLAALSIMAGPPDDRVASAPATQTVVAPEEVAVIDRVPDSDTPAKDTPEIDTPEIDTPDADEPVDDAPIADAPAEDDSETAAAGMAPQSSEPPRASPVEVPAGSVFNAAREDGQAVLPGTDTAPDTGAAPTLSLDTQAPATPLALADRSPAATPPVDQGIGGMTPPAAPLAAPDMASLSDQSAPRNAAPAEPSQPAPQETAPQIAPRGPSVSDTPQQPDQAQISDAGDTVTAPEAPRPRVPYTSVPQPRSDEAARGQARPQTLAQPAPQAAPQRQALPVIEPAPPAVTPDPDAPEAPEAPNPADTAAPIRPAIGTLATSLVDRPAAQSRVVTDDTPDATPLERNALPFEDPENRPRLSIILIDRGDSVVDAAALQDFPYPLTFAVDATRPDAADASARYREAGFEVMALVDLAPESTAQDAEVAMEASLAAVPDAVAVMEGDATGLQTSRAVSDQVSAILAQRGYGLVMLPNGLNTAQKLAAKSGVPSATVFRDFDGAGQNAAAIRRFLDQGAFKAGQRAGEDGVGSEDAGVIMMGRLRPDTISALLLWGLQDRARRVALAPVSAVLTEGQ